MIFDLLSLSSIALYLALGAITLATQPQRDREPGRMVALAFIAGGTLLAYCAASLPLFALGWTLTIVPYWTGWLPSGPRLALTAGTVALLAGVGLTYATGDQFEGSAPLAAFATLTLAALLRKGIFPFHSWVPRGFAQSPLLPLGLLYNGHLGAFLILRFAIPLLPGAAVTALPFMSILALITALYASVMALSEKTPVRVLALMSVSQASFLLAGIENRNVEGITGALVYWFVVATATTGLLCVYRSLEARYTVVSNPTGFLGLAGPAPRLAVFFAMSGLALIGLPGTLGFAAEDLLFHGSLESHPLLGVTLPLATALNAITMYRLFSVLFLGKGGRAVPAIPDALPRERWALTAAVCFLVITGFLPSLLVSMRTPAAEHLAGILMTR
jgi:NADH-quinone oxidoreductase subunit M